MLCVAQPIENPNIIEYNNAAFAHFESRLTCNNLLIKLHRIFELCVTLLEWVNYNHTMTNKGNTDTYMCTYKANCRNGIAFHKRQSSSVKSNLCRYFDLLVLRTMPVVINTQSETFTKLMSLIMNDKSNHNTNIISICKNIILNGA